MFQDLAIIPLLAVLPLLGAGDSSLDTDGMLQDVLIGVAALIVLVVGGHYLLRPIFRLISASRSHDIFIASSLMIVVGSTLLMEQAGLSMALGAFIAGVLLADSEYRHEVEANIEPFKGLLLGLFFIAVGMSVNIGQLAAEPLSILALVGALLLIKFVVLYVLGQLFSLPVRCSRNLAFVLPQGGEFAFVLFAAAVSQHVLDQALVDNLILIVSLSMAATPLLVMVNEKLLRPWLDGTAAPAFDRIDDSGNPVIIAGFGRVGQIVGRILRVKKIPFTALEVNPTQVDFVRKFGGKIYYGDASRIELLRAAHAEQARIFVLAIDDIESSLRTVETVKKHFPHLQIIARARNRHHVHMLMDHDIRLFVRETYLSSLQLAEYVLSTLGQSKAEVQATITKFKDHDEANLLKQHAIHHDESRLIQSVKDAAAELEELFELDD